MSNNKPILTAGNDFYLRVNVYTVNAQGEREPFNLSACDKWAFFLRNTYGAISETTFGLEEGSLNTILVDCKEIKRSMGYMAEVVAVLNGRNLRCAERGVFAITGYNADANVTFEVYEAEEGQDLDMDFQIVSSAEIVGKNAYELAVEQGYEGTLGDWLADIVHDADYVHTDNNFTDEDKSKVDNMGDMGVWEINASGTITGTIPNITIVINDYASFYADLVDANAQGKVPVVRMHLTQGGNVYEYSGIASSYNGWQFVGTFQMQGNYVSYNVFNRPTDTVPYEIDVVRLQEQLVSGTNIKTVNNQSLLGAGNINIKSDGLQSFEFIECNITAVDGSDKATVSNNNWHTEAIAAYEAKKIPVLCGQAISSGTIYSMILTVEKYTAGGDDYRIYGSAAITVGGSSPRRNILYAEMQSTHSNASLYISDFVDKLVSGQNIKTINGNSLVGGGNVTIPTGLSVAYEVVDAGMLYLDQTNTYYEVPASVYTALKAVWDAGKVPVLKGNLDGLESNMGAFTTTVSLDNSVGAFRFFAHNSNPGRRTSNFSSWGRILSDGGRIYITEEYVVVQTVQAGSTNPVSGAGVKTYVDNALAGTPQQIHTNEVAATLSPEIVHIFTGTTDTLAITLTAPTDALSHLFTMILTTGTTPAVTIQVSDSTAIIYPDDYAIEAGTTYEISVLVANGKYYLRYVSYQEA